MSTADVDDQALLDYILGQIRNDAVMREQLMTAMQRKDASRVADVLRLLLKGIKNVAPYVPSVVLAFFGISL